MKFKIGRGGLLEIERAGKWKKQYCPFAESENGGETPAACGDWCPHFGEPYEYPGEKDPIDAIFILLELCHERELEALLSDFTDEREVPK